MASVGWVLAWVVAAPVARAQDGTPRQAETPSQAETTAEWTLESSTDGGRTLGALPRNVARGVVGVFSRNNLGPLLIGGGAAFSSHGLDHGTARLIQDDCRTCGKTGAAVGGGIAVVPAIGALFVAGRLAPAGRFRAFSYDMAEATIVTFVWTDALKYSLQRTRPDRRDRLSFPSGHTSAAFSLATVAEQHYGWRVGLPAFTAAAFVGYSRIERNRHHLSDVLAGATLGIIVGRTVTRLNGGAVSRRALSIGPATDANGGGVGLGVSASW